MQALGAAAKTFLGHCAREDAVFDARQSWPGAYLAMQRAAAYRGLSMTAWRVYDRAYQAAARMIRSEAAA